MTDYYDPYDPYAGYVGDTEGSGQSEDDFIRMLIESGGLGTQMPGKTPTNRLSYFNSFANATGLPLAQLAGISGETPEQAQPFSSDVAAVWGSNPQYAKMFEDVDAGADPISAAKSAGFAPEDIQNAVDVATKYKTDQVQYNRNTDSNMASYSRRDGSKYKNTPLGGSDVFGFANEYDLLGRPSEDDLVKNYANWRVNNGMAPSHKGGVDIAPGVEKVGDRTYHSDPSGLSDTQRFQMERQLKHRLDQARNTNVRSDAGMNAAKRIMFLRAMTGD